MRLLVSVTDAHEARVAVEGGVDIVDVKNPAEGALGAPAPGGVERVRQAVPAERPVSVAIGDLPNLPGTAALAALGAARCGAAYVKVGLWGTSTTDEAVAVLRAVRDAVDGGATVIAAAYADAERVHGGPVPPAADAERAPRGPLPPGAVVEAARRAGAGGCLLDTAVKDGRGLFEWLTPEALTALVAEGHAAGLEMALAGALRAEDLSLVRATGADIAGVRSAACRDGRRTAPLDAERIRRLRAICDG